MIKQINLLRKTVNDYGYAAAKIRDVCILRDMVRHQYDRNLGSVCCDLDNLPFVQDLDYRYTLFARYPYSLEWAKNRRKKQK